MAGYNAGSVGGGLPFELLRIAPPLLTPPNKQAVPIPRCWSNSTGSSFEGPRRRHHCRPHRRYQHPRTTTCTYVSFDLPTLPTNYYRSTVQLLPGLHPIDSHEHSHLHSPKLLPCTFLLMMTILESGTNSQVGSILWSDSRWCQCARDRRAHRVAVSCNVRMPCYALPNFALVALGYCVHGVLPFFFK